MNYRARAGAGAGAGAKMKRLHNTDGRGQLGSIRLKTSRLPAIFILAVLILCLNTSIRAQMGATFLSKFSPVFIHAQIFYIFFLIVCKIISLNMLNFNLFKFFRYLEPLLR